MSTDAGVRAPATHLSFVDNLRVALTALVVLHHVAVMYSDIPLWYYGEPAHGGTGLAVDVFLGVNQTFFMGFFFLIAGYFTPGAHDRKGGGRFARDRLLRLGVPFLLFAAGLRAVLTIPEAAASGLPYWRYYLSTWDPGPTWFLAVLLAFGLLYALLRRFRPGAVQAPSASAPRGRAVAGCLIGLAVLTFLWQQLVPPGSYVPGLGLPSADYLPQYAAMFVAGVLAYRRGWLDALPRHAGRVAWITAAVSGVVLIPPMVLATGLVPGISRAGVESVFAASLILGLITLFRRHFDTQGVRARFLSDNAFAVYVLHALVVTLLGFAFSWLAVPALLKFALAGVLALALSWSLAAGVRAVPPLRKFL